VIFVQESGMDQPIIFSRINYGYYKLLLEAWRKKEDRKKTIVPLLQQSF
jgi:hypothetical protein